MCFILQTRGGQAAVATTICEGIDPVSLFAGDNEALRTAICSTIKREPNPRASSSSLRTAKKLIEKENV